MSDWLLRDEAIGMQLRAVHSREQESAMSEWQLFLWRGRLWREQADICRTLC